MAATDQRPGREPTTQPAPPEDNVRTRRGDQLAEAIADVVGNWSVLGRFAWHEHQATIRAFAERPVTR
jgi:hypothetical protein